MSSGVVLFDPRSMECSLYLTGIKRFPDGSIKTGFVENGHWDFERRNGECLAKDGNSTRNRWPDPGYIEVPVEPEWRGGYNHIMAKAQEKFK
jgi:hypothetical protein